MEQKYNKKSKMSFGEFPLDFVLKNMISTYTRDFS
jgi:hypothetical protein